MTLRPSSTVVIQKTLIYNTCNTKEYYPHCHLVVILHYWRTIPRKKRHTVQCVLSKIFFGPKLKPRYSRSKRSLIGVFRLSLLCDVWRYMLAIPTSRAKQWKTNWTLKNGEIGCPENLVGRCQHASCNISGERRPKLHCGENLKYLQIVITDYELTVRSWDEKRRHEFHTSFRDNRSHSPKLKWGL
jgi:hypothetical protein